VFTIIVVGTDGSKGAERAIRAAAAVAGRSPGAALHVVTAYQPLTPRQMNELAEQLPEEFRSVLSADMGAGSRLDSARALLVDAGVEAEYHEVSDDPTDAILDVVERVGADLVVVGSRGEGSVKRAIHGSVSTKVLHHAPCSVLVVKD
jgi:nucleotide-binding universal stress UspA family protein